MVAEGTDNAINSGTTVITGYRRIQHRKQRRGRPWLEPTPLDLRSSPHVSFGVNRNEIELMQYR
jgi:hypothetical protein